MLFLLILPVLVVGFVACHIHPVHSYKLHRYEGQYLYLKSAQLGLVCFMLAFSIAMALHFWLPNSIEFRTYGAESLTASHTYQFNLTFAASLADTMKVIGAKDDVEASNMAWFFILSALTFVSAYLIKILAHADLRIRFGTWSTRVHVIAQILEDSPLDNLLFNLSLDKDKYVMLSMDDRKVYVGKVISLGEPSETIDSACK